MPLIRHTRTGGRTGWAVPAPFAPCRRPRLARRLDWVVFCLLGLAGRPLAAEPAPLADPRLATPVQLALVRKPLAAIVADVQRQTGVPLACDREVADEPAVALVRSCPGRDVLRHLAELFDFRWERSGSSRRPGYRLLRDEEGRREEARMRREDRLKILERLQASVKRESMAAAERGDARRQALLGIGSLLTPPHWEQLLEGEDVLLSSLAGDGGARPAPEVLRALRQSEPPGGDARPRPTSGGCPGGYPAPLQYRIRCWIELTQASAFAQAALHIQARALRPGFEAARPPGPLQVLGVLQRPAPPPPAPETRAAWVRDPVLGLERGFRMQPIAAQPDGRTRPRLYEILPAIAETYQVDLIADAYREHRPVPTPAAAPQPLLLHEALERFVHPAAAWSSNEGLLRVRSHTWFNERLTEIPSALLKQSMAQLRERSRFTLDHAAALALDLSDTRLGALEAALCEEGARLAEPFPLRTGLVLSGNAEVLRTYASLSAAQRRTLLAGRGVPYADLSAAARHWLHRAHARRQRQHTSGAPPGGVPGGILWLSTGALAAGRPVVEEEEAPAPPPPSPPPRLFQQVTFRHQYDESFADTFTLTLPALE